MASRPGTLVREWLLLLGCLLAVSGVVLYWLHADLQDLDRRSREQLTTQARVVRDNLGRQLEAIRRAQINIRDEMIAGDDPKGSLGLINRRLAAFVDAMPGVRTMLVLDARGKALASTRPELVGHDFSEREHFLAPLKSPDRNTFYVSPPFKTVLDVWAMNVSTMLPGASGEFAGVVTSTLPRRSSGPC